MLRVAKGLIKYGLVGKQGLVVVRHDKMCYYGNNECWLKLRQL